MKNLIIIFLLVFCIMLSFLLLRNSGNSTRYIKDVRIVHDTVKIVRWVPRRVVAYQARPQVHVDSVSSDTGHSEPRFTLVHDTVTVQGDSVHIRVTYPPPTLRVYFSTAPISDTTTLYGIRHQIWARDTILMTRRNWEELVAVGAGGVVLGVIITLIAR